MSNILNQRNAELATKFSHLDLSTAPTPVDFSCQDMSAVAKATKDHVKAMLEWLKSQDQSLSIPDFIDLLAFHNNATYQQLVEAGGYWDFFDINEDFFNSPDSSEYKIVGRSVNRNYQDDSDGEYYVCIRGVCLPDEDELEAEADFRNSLILQMALPTKLEGEPSKVTVWTNTEDFRDFDQRENLDVLDWFKSNFTSFSKAECENMTEEFMGLVDGLPDGQDTWW